MTICKTCGYSSWCDCPKADDKNVNANELANELNRLQQIYPLSIPFVLDEAATMLRQKQNEIEDLINAHRFVQNFAEEQHQRAVALESELDRAVELYTDKVIENEALKKSHIELERGIVKDLNQRQRNEPVAWINKVTFQYLTELGYSAKVYPKRSDGDIPLYTHPVKEQDGCGNCHACLVGVTEHGLPVTFQRMILCPDCGNKRCPKASNHRHQCTESNEPNQRGSIYTHPVTEHFEGEPQAEELHEILQSNAELTDEEIMDELVKVKHTWVATTSVWYEFEKEELKKAIRAILRKASEK